VPQTIGLANASLRQAWADVEGKNADAKSLSNLRANSNGAGQVTLHDKR
jgi:hypothetical protein